MTLGTYLSDHVFATMVAVTLFSLATGWLSARSFATSYKPSTALRIQAVTGVVLAGALCAEIALGIGTDLISAAGISALIAGAWFAPVAFIGRNTQNSTPTRTFSGATASAAPPSIRVKSVSAEELNAAAAELAEKIKSDFGKRAKRLHITGASANGRGSLEVRFEVNDYELKKAKVGGKSFDEFRAEFPANFNGIPVNLTFAAAK